MTSNSIQDVNTNQDFTLDLILRGYFYTLFTRVRPYTPPPWYLINNKLCKVKTWSAGIPTLIDNSDVIENC